MYLDAYLKKIDEYPAPDYNLKEEWFLIIRLDEEEARVSLKELKEKLKES